MGIKENIKALRESHDLSQKELAKIAGVTDKAVSSWETGEREPRMGAIQKIADYFGLRKSDIIEDSPSLTPPRTKGIRIPILGRVVAGVPLEAIEDIEGYEEITPAMASKGEYFALKVKGASMTPFILDGDIVIVRKQETADSGDIVIVLVNGDEATVKEIKIREDGLMLIGKNVVVYSPRFYNLHEIEELPVKIIGKVVEVRRSL